MLMMKESELVQVFFSRVSAIVNQIRSYGDTIANKRIVEKILRSLPQKFDVVASIEESKDLANLTLHELAGSLEAYEKRISRSSEGSFEQAFQAKVNIREGKGKESSREGSKGIYHQKTHFEQGSNSF